MGAPAAERKADTRQGGAWACALRAFDLPPRALPSTNARRDPLQARRRRRAAAAAAAAALAAKPKGAAEAAPRPAAEQTAHVSARSAPGEGPLYRVSENELIVHQLLLTGE